MVFPVFKTILLLLAMTTFVAGLRTLRLRSTRVGPLPERRDAVPAKSIQASKPIVPSDPV